MENRGLCVVIAFFVLLIALGAILCACAPAENNGVLNEVSQFPKLLYRNSTLVRDPFNRQILIQKGYVLDEAHSYDIVQYNDSYDIVLHFVKELPEG